MPPAYTIYCFPYTKSAPHSELELRLVTSTVSVFTPRNASNTLNVYVVSTSPLTNLTTTPAKTAGARARPQGLPSPEQLHAWQARGSTQDTKSIRNQRVI